MKIVSVAARSTATKFPDLISTIQRLVTPAESRWARKAAHIATQAAVIMNVADLNSAIAAKVLDIGQGGMFVKVENQFPQVGVNIERVSLVRTIITRPKLLLLDEPLSQIDPVRRQELGNPRWVSHGFKHLLTNRGPGPKTAHGPQEPLRELTFPM